MKILRDYTLQPPCPSCVLTPAFHPSPLHSEIAHSLLLTHSVTCFPVNFCFSLFSQTSLILTALKFTIQDFPSLEITNLYDNILHCPTIRNVSSCPAINHCFCYY